MSAKYKLKKWVRSYGYFTSQIMFLLVAVFALLNALSTKKALESVEHSYQVLADIESVGNSFGHAEASQRGYILSGNSEYLDSYKSSLDDLKIELQNLKDRVADNPEQLARVVSIGGILADRITLLDLRIREKQTGNVEIDALGSTAAGNTLTKRLRLHLEELEKVEQSLLAERKQIRESSTEQSGFVVVLATLAAVLLGITSRQIIKKERDDNYQQAKLTSMIIESMRDGLVVVNEEGMFTIVNKAAQSFIGTDVKNILPKDRAKAFGMRNPETNELFDSQELPLARAMKGEHVHEMEVIFKNKLHPDGVLCSVTGMPLLNEANEVTGAMATFRDISKRKATEQEWKIARQAAIEASKLKSEFLATMSHEIRTPMNGVLGMSTLLADTKLNSEQFEFVNIIRKSTQSLLTLINGILDLSKIEAGKLSLDPAFFDLREMVSDTVELFRFAAAEKKIKLTMNVSFESGLGVFGDSDRLRQVLVNLIGNAIKFTEDGEVTVTVTNSTASTGKQKFRFEVKDSGIGLTEEEIQKLFVKYGQTMSGVKKGGSGLGLLISQQLINLMGSHIQIESEKGTGSTFWFEVEFEVSKAEYCVVPARSLSSEVFKGSVLVVEDQKVNQKVISSILARLGVECSLADNGQQALELCKSHSYDLVFMDCRMPVMDGYEATEKIRSMPTWKDVPIVALSAEGASGDRERCFQVGMNDFVSKPIEMPVLLNVLKKYLKSSQNQIDENALKQFDEFSKDDDLVLVLIDEYKKAYPESLKQLFEAEKAGNLKELNEVAHGLKSSSAALGMVKVAEICQWLEDAVTPSKQIKSRMQELELEILSAVRILTELKTRKA
ncbi:MAG: signal transduction histidine kinase [Pseudobdellovibrio sp.]|jgi:PAS domain S-box-containing protein|nr:signal transduction histidine kinase [Pseudobdellovibrio sp.]